MRKIILDTETSGLDPNKDRIIEVGCVELINDIPSGKVFHQYYSPGNIQISEQAENIHGLSNSFLKDYVVFDERIDELLDFIDNSVLVIHNAQFDISMINSSLKRLKLNLIKEKDYICTLTMARKKFPGSKVNLNALCRKYGISIEHREKHDAITDCFLLAQVYIELIGGKQNKFNFNQAIPKKIINEESSILGKRITPLIFLSEKEKYNHKRMIDKLKNPIWKI